MRVHSAPHESLRFGDISVYGHGRMDNLLKAHSYLTAVLPGEDGR
jgi:hypothetical protein